MINTNENDPKPISETLPELIEILEKGGPIAPDTERIQANQSKDLREEARELSEEREALGETIVAGDTSPETRARFDQITRDLLSAQSDHISLDGTTGSVPPNE